MSIQLAFDHDVEDALGRDLTATEAARVDSILTKASELFRAESGQLFTEGRSHVRLKVNAGRVYLTQRPATEIHALTDDAGNSVPYSTFGQWLEVNLGSHEFVRVDYSHGGEVPDLVRVTVAEVAKKVLMIADDAARGISQGSHTDGPFTDSATYATWAQGGQTMLAPDDKAVAASFRIAVPNVWVVRR